MTAIDLTSYVEDYETAETRAHKHALDIAYIWSKLRTVVEQPLLITSRHAISPCHRSAQPSRRLDVKLNLQVMALLRKMQTAPSPQLQHMEMGPLYFLMLISYRYPDVWQQYRIPYPCPSLL